MNLYLIVIKPLSNVFSKIKCKRASLSETSYLYLALRLFGFLEGVPGVESF